MCNQKSINNVSVVMSFAIVYTNDLLKKKLCAKPLSHSVHLYGRAPLCTSGAR